MSGGKHRTEKVAKMNPPNQSANHASIDSSAIAMIFMAEWACCSV